MIDNLGAAVASITATFLSSAVVAEGSASLDVEDVAVTIANGSAKLCGPWTANFEQATPNAGQVWINWTGDAAQSDVIIVGLRLP